MKKFVITGGNFMNAGAAAMSYITISELRKRYPDCYIYMIIDYGDGTKYDQLKCDICYISSDSMRLLNHQLSLSRLLKSIVKKIIGREDIFNQVNSFKQIIKECDAVFDISGYIISSQWDISGNLNKLGQLNYILDSGKPCYIMPQSFGPFDFGNKTDSVVSEIKHTFSRCNVVFAREKQGFKLLKEDLGLNNVLLSHDMVLQNKAIEWDLVLYSEKSDSYFDYIEEDNNVGVIPNMRILDHSNRTVIMNVYSELIKTILSFGKNVYLICHSAEDFSICNMLKKLFPQKTVHLIKNNISSIEFEILISKMDFAIASRFHSIVHAYKNGVPCLILGWALKYEELASLFVQDKYYYDTQMLCDVNSVVNSVTLLNENYIEEKKIITEKLVEIQQNNCFDKITF